jgi:hypothetical protein
MAEHVGIYRSFISDLENGKKEICLRNLEVVAEAFDMTISQLLLRHHQSGDVVPYHFPYD